MEVTAPVLVVKSKKLGTALTAASLLAAPFTGGASLAAGAAARGAMVGVQGARAAIAGKKAAQASNALGAAQKTSQTALTASSLPLGESTIGVTGPHHRSKAATKRFADAPGKDASLANFRHVAERGGEGPQAMESLPDPAEGTGANTSQSSFTPEVMDAYETENIAQQNVNAAQSQSDKMNEKLQDAQKNYDDSQKTNTPIGLASAAGAYGFNQMEQHKKQNEANQKAEMERIEGLAESARSKASTGTGGKVAVA